MRHLPIRGRENANLVLAGVYGSASIAKRVPHVAILANTSTGWGRRLVRGVLNFAKMHGPWSIWIHPLGIDEKKRLPDGWEGDGIIARIADLPMYRHIAEREVPTVNVSSIELPDVDLPRVTNDIKGTARLAVEYFLERGHWQFAYCGFESRSYIRRQSQAYREVLKELGYDCHQFQLPPKWNRLKFEQRQAAVAEWLHSLPKPCAMLTWAVYTGRDVVNTCRDEGIHVPNEIAVLGADEDDLLCETCWPSLSGTEAPSEQIGFQAAEMLQKLMSGKKLKKSRIEIRPTGIVTRQSTDSFAIEDPELVAALQYIRQHAGQRIKVTDVADAVNVSRRSLERRVRKLLGRSLRDEIARMHLERATMLLATTEMTIPQVAEAAGYGSAEYFATVFREERGISPMKYRARVRGRAASA